MAYGSGGMKGAGSDNMRTVAGPDPAPRAVAAVGASLQDEPGPAGETRSVVIDRKPDGGFAVTCVKANGSSVPSEYPDLAGALQYAMTEFGGEEPAAPPAEQAVAAPAPSGAMPA